MSQPSVHLCYEKKAANYLGLSIARFLAELHGGHLTVSSTVGVGSVFSLYLPAKGPRDGHHVSILGGDETAAFWEPNSNRPGAEPRTPVTVLGPPTSN